MDTIKRTPGRSKSKLKGNPFHLVQEIRDRIRASAGSAPVRVKYLWLYVTPEGLDGGGDRQLSTEEWLNVIDEAGALGAQWVVVCWQGSPGSDSQIWQICKWAQDTHDCHVGIHVMGDGLSTQDVEKLLGLRHDRTYVLAARNMLDSLRFLEQHDIEVCEADVNVAHRTGTCTLPDDMVCVGPEGKLYTCGLVLGDERFCLGNIFDQSFATVVTDQSLPHHVPDSVCREGNHHNCDACPPLMVERTLQRK
jgi:radical SAM protein with 4Fe4S-binding SPASM domain